MNQNTLEHVRLGRGVCDDLTQAERREWWLANGRGAYAAGTVAGTLTRRYHGLLVAPLDPPLGRYLVFAKADAMVTDGEREWPLFANRWASGVIAPQGYVHLQSFHLDGRMPVWQFAIGGALIEMRVWLEHGADTVYVAYRLSDEAKNFAGRRLGLRVRLLVNGRDHHGNTRAQEFNPDITADAADGSAARSLLVRTPDSHLGRGYRLQMQVRGGTITPDHTWYENFDLPLERERGLPALDNHLCVAQALLDLHPGEWVGLVASLQSEASPYLEESLRRFQANDAGVLKRTRVQVPELHEAPTWVQQLVLAADSFVFSRPLPDLPDGESVIAGYPWFGDWGRDTMIALPGLTLATGRYDSARRILETFARFVDGGMLPNVFPGAGATADYNTVDAALWYLEAWRAYVEATGDLAALARVWPVLQSIIAAHRQGTRYGIRTDATDGLLYAGEKGVQLTWMDAKIGDWVVTPRTGKPVEINALWYNALQAMADFAKSLQQSEVEYRLLAEQTCEGFKRFVKPDESGLYDVLDGPDGNDARVRPNQIFAVSLPHSPLDPVVKAQVVKQCYRELLCGPGLRSLAPSDPDYRPRYEGGVWERDSRYHQGPVWAWLLGHYALAEYRVHGNAAAAQARMEAIRDHLLDAGMGTVSEIFDGEAPFTPRGAPSQAWSVACVLEAWWRLEKARRQALIVNEDKRAAAQPSLAVNG
ncbi:MAG: amylo-alpha-1,6-glucosidase [Chromatiales bacterium]